MKKGADYTGKCDAYLKERLVNCNAEVTFGYKFPVSRKLTWGNITLTM